MEIILFLKKTKFARLKSIYFQFKTTTKQMSVFSFQRDWQKVYFGKNPLERDVPTLRVNAYQISFKSKAQMVM